MDQPTLSKICSMCETEKLLSEYNKKSSRADGLDYKCRDCAKDMLMKTRYGVTPEQYKKMLDNQGHKCYICKEGNKRSLVVDHCHLTSKVRGLLCDRCNLGLGKFRDSPMLVERALKYLRRYSGGVGDED